MVSSIVESVTEGLRAYPGARVLEVRLKVGALAGVVEDSLQFCWGIATDGEASALAGSRLVVQTVPVMVHCAACGGVGPLASLQDFVCPQCGAPATDVRGGRVLEIESIEIEEGSGAGGASAVSGSGQSAAPAGVSG